MKAKSTALSVSEDNMVKQPTISSLQLMFLTVGCALMFPYTYMPILTNDPKNQDVWVSLMFSTLYLVVLNAPLVYIMSRFRGLTITQVFDLIAGSVLGKVISVIFSVIFLMCFYSCLVIAQQFINTSLMPETPAIALSIIALIPATYASIKGAGVIARISVFIYFLVFTTVLVFGVFGIPKMDINNLKPVLADSSFMDINKGAFINAARFTEINMLFVFSYFLKKEVSVRKVYFIVVIMFVVLFSAMLLPVLLTLGYEYAKLTLNPYFVFTKQVKFYEMLEKVQSLNTFVWFPGTLIKTAAYNFMLSFICAQLFKKVHRTYFAVMFSVLVAIISSIKALNNTLVSYMMINNVWPISIFSVSAVLPLILVIVYRLNKKRTDGKLKDLLKEMEIREVDNAKEQAAMGRIHSLE